MSIFQIFRESFRILFKTKLVWLMSCVYLVLTINFSQFLPKTETVICFYRPISLLIYIIVGMVEASIILLVYHSVINKQSSYSEVWKETSSKYFFRIIGAGFLLTLANIIPLFIYMLFRTGTLDSPIFIFVSMIYLSIVYTQFYISSCAILIDNFEAGKAVWLGLRTSFYKFFHFLSITGFVLIVQVFLILVFIALLNALPLSISIPFPSKFTLPSYHALFKIPLVNISAFVINLVTDPVLLIAMTLSYLKFRPQKTETIPDPQIEKEAGLTPPEN